MKEYYLKKKHFSKDIVKTLFLIFILFGSIFVINAQNCTVNAGVLSETICATDILTLQGNTPSPIIGTVQWTQVSGPSVIINSPNTPNTAVSGYTGGNTYIFRYSATCGDGIFTFQDKTVIVLPITIADAGTAISSCPNSSGGVTITGNAPQNSGETGEWQIVGANDAGVVINFPNSATSTVTLPQTSCGTTTVQWVIRGPDYAPGQFCQTSSQITITNYGGVTPVSAGSDQTLSNCYTSTQSVNLNGSYGGCGLNGQIGTWEFVSGPNTPTINNSNSGNTSVNNLIEGTYVFRWTVTGPCASGSDEVTITVPAATQDVTTLPGGTEDIYFCDSTVTQATLEGETPLYAGETVLWTQTGGSPATIVSPNNPTTLVTGISDSGDPYTFTYTLTNANTGCTFSKNYNIYYSGPTRTIEANGGNDIFGTCNQTNFSIPLTVTGTGSNYYRILSGPAGSPLSPFPTAPSTVGNSLDITLTIPGTYAIQFARTEDGNLPIGCNYGLDSITILVSGDPTPSNAGSDVNLNCGVSTTPLAGIPPTVGLAVWSQLSGPNQAVIADHFAPSTTASGLIPGTYIFQYITKGGGTACPLSIDTVTVNVSDSILSNADAGSDQSACVLSQAIMAGNTPQSGEFGQWSQVGGPLTVVFSDVNDPNAIATGFNAPNETYVLRWSIGYTNPGTSGCVTPDTDDVNINTNSEPGPSIADAGSDTCYPSGTTVVQLNGNSPTVNETGLWTVTPAAGVTFSDATLFNTSATVPGIDTYTFTWTITKNTGSCSPTTDDVVVTIADTPVAGAGPDQNICGDTIVMAATISAGAQGEWSRVSGLGSYTISDINDPNATFVFEFSGIYVFRWTVEATPCSTAFDDVQLTVGIPPITADAGSDQDICGATSTVLSGSTYDAFFETGEWSLLSGAPNIPTIADSADPNTAISNLVTGTYTFRWSIASKGNFLCPSSFDDVIIQVAPPANAGSDQTHCDVTSVQLIGNANSTGTWTQTAGPPSTITQSPVGSYVANATVIPGNNYTFQYTTSDFGFTSGGTCAGSSDTVDVVVFDGSSIPPDAGSDQTICIQDVGGTVTLNGNTPPGDVDSAEWRWVFQPSGSVASITDPALPGTTVTNLTVPGLYILEWVFLNTSCRDLSDIVRINVYEAPSTADAGPDDTVACQQTYTTDAVAPTAGIGAWSFASGGDPSSGTTVIDSPNNPQTTLSNITLGTYTLLWTVSNGPFTNPSLCEPSTDTVTIIFNDDPPSIANAGPDQELCAVTQTNLAAVPLTSGLGTWTQTSGASANIASANDPDTLVFGLTTGVYEFTWTATTVNNDGCSSQDTMQIEIFATPSTADAGPDQILPQFSPVIMAAVAPVVGTGRWSQISGPTTASFTDETLPTTAVSGTIAGTYVFQWEVTNGPCTTSTDLVTIEIISIVDLELTKSVAPTTAVVGNPVTFTISVFNNNALGGSVDATGVGVRDLLPTGYTLVPGTVGNGGVYNPGDFSITWSNLAITNGATLNLTFDATINATGGYLNIAEIITCDQIDDDSTPNNDDGDQSEDDEDNAQVTPIPASTDLSLTKTVVAGNTTPMVGSQVSFEIVVTNNGPLDATGVEVVDLLPSGYDFVNFSSSAGLYNETTGLWDVGTVDNATSESLIIDAIVLPTGDYFNIAQVTASDLPDPDSAPNNDDGDQSEDDEDNAVVVPVTAVSDLSLTKIVNNTTPLVGSQVIFTIQIGNNGPQSASNVVVNDDLPTGYTYISHNVTAGVFNPVTGFWQINTIAAGDNETLQIIATVNATGNYENIAEVTNNDVADSDSTPGNGITTEDDYDSVATTPTPLAADLSLTKTLVNGNTTPLIGSQITFNVTVANAGPQAATGVSVTDTLPTGYTFVSSNATQGNYNSTTGIWTVGNVGSGDAETLIISVIVNATGNYLNIAEVATSNQTDPDSTPGNTNTGEDDYASVTTTPTALSADLSLTKAVNNATPLVGSQVIFTVTAASAGPDDTSGVVVTDLLPTGYTYVSSNATQGGYDSVTGVWTVGAMANGASEILQITATVNATGSYLNTAEVTASSLPDPDSTVNNGTVTEDDYATAITIPIFGADLSLTKTIVGGNTTPLVGSQITFNVTVSNAGPEDATGVTITDALPTGYTFVSSNATEGVYDAGTGVWTVGSILRNDSETLQVTVIVNATGNYENIAEVATSDQTDPDSTPGNTVTTEDDYATAITVPTALSADLSLTKTVNSATPLVGSQVIFTVTIASAGSDDTSGVTVTDLLPTGYTYVSSNATQGGYDSVTGVWTVGAMTNGASEILQITATVNATGPYLNTAEVTASSLPDPDSTVNNGNITEDDYATAITIPTALSADLSLTKAVNNATPLVGSQVIFTVTIASAGPDDTSGVTVTDLLPTGYTYMSSNATQGGYDSVTGVWTVGAMTNGASEILQITATVNATGPYLNTAEVTASSLPDPDSTVNNGTVTEDDYATAITVPTALAADLSLTKTVNNATPLVGSQVIFTVTAASAGPDDTSGVTVTDLLPTGYTYVSSNATQGGYDSVTGVWTVGAMTNGASEILQITATVNATGPYLNTAEVTASSLPDPDSTVNNGNITEDDYATAITIPTALSADLSLTKAVNNATPLVGSQVIFTVTIASAGPDDTSGVTVTDLLPTGYTYISSNATQGGYDSVTGVWTVGAMANGASEILQITATVNATGPYLNTAEVTASSLPDPDSTVNNGNITEDDYATAITIPTALSADLSLTKAVNNATPLVGSQVIFTVTAASAGPDDTSGVTVTDLLPTGYTYVSSNATQGGYDSVTGVWTVGAMANGASEILQITATVNATGPYLNTAEVTASSLPDPDSTVNNGNITEDDYATAITIPTALSADLSLTKTVNSATPLVGSQVIFTVTVASAGPDDTSGVTVTDLLPTGYTYISSNATQGGYDSVTGVWTVGAMTNGASEILQITATVNATGSYLNTAEVTASSLPDPDSTVNNGTVTEDDYATAITIPTALSADLSLTKTVSNATPLVGSQVIFTVTIASAGPDDTSGVTITDALPTGYTYISSNATQGGYDSVTGVWTVGAMTNGASEILQITATVNATGVYLNTAEVTASSLPDPDSTVNNGTVTEDDYATAITVPTALAADLSLTKTVNNATPLVGSQVIFTVTAASAGPDDTSGVVVTDLLPTGYTYVSSNATQGGYDSVTGVWTVGAMANGASEILQITATVNATGPYLNTAEVTASSLPDPDSTVNNGTVTEDDYASVTTTPIFGADLSLTKTIVGGNTTPLVGSQITFNVTVSNAGPEDATGVTITDALPTGYTFVSSNATEGVYDAGTGVWTVGSISRNDSETLQVTVIVNATGNYENIAEVATSDQTDPDSTPGNTVTTEDDYASITTTPTALSADLSLTKAVNNATPLVGSQVIFTVTAASAGPDDTSGVTVTDLLPTGYTYVSSNATQGGYDSVTGVWTVGAMANGASEILQITATVNATGVYLNTAEATASSLPDPDSTVNNGTVTEDDYASVTTIPTALSADLSLTKTIVGGNTTPLVGSQISFEVIINNAGPDTASGVQVTDLLPTGYTYTIFSATAGSYSNVTGIWNIGTMVSGDTETLIVTAIVTAAGNYENIAEVTASSLPDPDSTVNNGSITEDDYDSIVTVPIPISADLSITKTVGNSTPLVGSSVVFTVVVTNNGPQDATDIQVTDQLPSGYSYIVATTTTGVYNNNTGIWQVGTIASGDSETLLINASVLATGDYLNIAEITTSSLPDPDSTPGNGNPAEDDYASVVTAPIAISADLSLTKTVNNPTPLIGSGVTFEIIITNNGPQGATGVEITDQLPSGYAYVLASATAGIYNSATGVWIIGALASGASETLLINGTVLATGSYENIAEVTASDQPDADSTPANSITTEDDYASAVTVPVPAAADLSITKTIVGGNTSPLVGTQMIFNVTVSNAGPQPATGVLVTDLLPSGYTFVSYTATEGAYNEATGVWDISSAIASGASATLQITVVVNATGNYLNIAEITSSNIADPDSTPGNAIVTEDDYASAATTPIAVSADLSITKTVNNPTPLIGSGVTFEIIITNNGPQGATGVEITDQLPSGYAYVLASATAGIYNSATGVWVVGTLASGASETLLINGSVLATGNYLNIAEVTASNEPDPDSTPANSSTTEDDYASAITVPVPAAADLSITKTIVGGNTSPLVGTQMIFNVTVSNAGPQPATGVLVTDLLPSGYTFVSYTATEGAYNNATGVWDISSAIISGASATLQVTVVVNATGNYLNITEITSSNIADPDSTPGNAIVTEDDYASAATTPIAVSADLSITKTVNNSAPAVGSGVTFEVIITNNGPQPATGVQVTDQLPSGYAYVLASTTAGIYNSATGVWVVGTLASGASETMLINGTVLATGSYLNIAEVTAGNEPDPDSTPANSSTTEDDYASAITVPVIPMADLSLVKTIVGGNSTPLVGSQIIFDITINNAGPQPVTNVQINDLLPSGYTFVSYDATEGVYNGVTGLWSIGGAIANGASNSLQVTATVNATGNYLNVAEITASSLPDPDSTVNNGITTEDDYATAITTPVPVSADLSITKTVNNATPLVGASVTFEVVITNNGPQATTGVQVTDLLPSGYTYVLASSTIGTYNSVTGLWIIGSLANGASETLLINATVNATGSYENIAQVSASNLPDPDSTPGNNITTEDDQASATVTPTALTADLSITKTVNNATPLVGASVTFEVVVTNNGPQPVTGVQVTDLLTSGYTYVLASSTIGTYNSVTGLWIIGSLANGASETLLINATVNATGSYENIAQVSASNLPDPDSTPGNNLATEDDQASATVTPTALVADLSITKAVNNATPLVGASVTFEVVVTNNGPQPVTGVQVTDLLPSGYTYVLASSTIGTYNSVTGLWIIGSLANGASETLLINATVNATGSYENIAQVSASNLPDPDSTPGNNITTEDDQASATVTPTALTADLSITKTVNNATPLVGASVTFEVVVTNNGPQATTGVQVTDLLPSGYTYVLASSTIGTYNSVTGLWIIGSLANGASETLLINATVNATGSYDNIAQVSASNLPDPDSTPGNNLATEDDQASTTVTPIALVADLSITKVVSDVSPVVGAQVTFEIVVSNDGSQDAEGITISDLLPTGYTYSFSSATSGIYDPITGVWNIGTIGNSSLEVLIVYAIVNATGNYENIAQVTSSSLPDPDSTPGNNVATEDDQASATVVPVVESADLSLAKIVDNATPFEGEQVTFEISVNNAGPQDATTVQVADLLPSGYVYVISSTTSGTYNPFTGLWNIGTITNGNTETLLITATVLASGNHLNIAQVTASDLPDPDSTPNNDDGDQSEDDEDAVAIQIPGTDIAITKDVDSTEPAMDSNVTFTITAANLGTLPATNLQITDVLPTGYEFVSADTTAGDYDPGTGLWSIPAIAANSLQTLTVIAKVIDKNDYLNTASLKSLDQIDTNASNNSDTAEVQPRCLKIYNEFSPNGDGENDTFYIDCILQYPNNVLEIFNRWGDKVYSRKGYDNTWEGTSDGPEKTLPVGTYYYIFDLGDGSDKESGWLYLKR